MLDQPLGAIGDQTPKPRIVQFEGRRYSVRLEPVFWRALEGLAEAQQLRLGRLVAELAERYDGGNFSSHLRVVCMLEAQRGRAQSLLQSDSGSMLDVVAACASPGLILSRYRTILGHNQALAEWLGPNRPSLMGADLTDIIQVRMRRPLNDVWLDMVAGNAALADANVLYVAPGRVSAAAARLISLRPAGGDFYAVMWLAPSGRPPAQTRPHRPA